MKSNGWPSTNSAGVPQIIVSALPIKIIIHFQLSKQVYSAMVSLKPWFHLMLHGSPWKHQVTVIPTSVLKHSTELLKIKVWNCIKMIQKQFHYTWLTVWWMHPKIATIVTFYQLYICYDRSSSVDTSLSFVLISNFTWF